MVRMTLATYAASLAGPRSGLAGAITRTAATLVAAGDSREARGVGERTMDEDDCGLIGGAKTAQCHDS
jgi:hypothetical protein